MARPEMGIPELRPLNSEARVALISYKEAKFSVSPRLSQTLADRFDFGRNKGTVQQIISYTREKEKTLLREHRSEIYQPSFKSGTVHWGYRIWKMIRNAGLSCTKAGSQW
jgi:hypothetical protein